MIELTQKAYRLEMPNKNVVTSVASVYPLAAKDTQIQNEPLIQDMVTRRTSAFGYNAMPVICKKPRTSRTSDQNASVCTSTKLNALTVTKESFTHIPKQIKANAEINSVSLVSCGKKFLII